MHNQRKIRLRPRWDNIIKLLLVVGVIVAIFSYIFYTSTFKIEYEEYSVNPDDTLFDIVQELNDYSPLGWNTYDFVSLTLDRNNLKKPTDLRAGEVIYVPVAYPKEK